MNKVVVFQSPSSMYEVVPPFYYELNKFAYFDTFYLATDQKDVYGLGSNVQVLSLKKDYGWEGNLARLLQVVKEDIFIMMCDDHVMVRQKSINLDKHFDTMVNNPHIGRLQLSPPSHNYYRFLKAHRNQIVIPDDAKSWYPYSKQYRFHVNFQPSLWRKGFLADVIRGGGNKSQLELRASERARTKSRYVSGYIGEYAIQYENFFASCQLHHSDPSFHRKKKAAHYREEFARYAMVHAVKLDPKKRVYVRRKAFSASVPIMYYVDHYCDDTAYQKFSIQRKHIMQALFKLKKRIKAKIAPYVSISSR